MVNKNERNTEGGDIPSTRKGLKDGYNRVTFIIRDVVAYKLNCIASIEDAFLKEIVNEALTQYVDNWERNNTKIPEKKRK